ncbi:MAG: hypothetical protein RIS64_590 [Bacteroidota bacterium]|jgi:AAA15 family ATPase/GTPase
MIKKINIKNFKSIQSLDMELGRFNVFIGANGCGKSNLLEAITFGSAALTHRLSDEFLTTRGIRMTQPSLMQSAFNKNLSQDIGFYFANEIQETITFVVSWEKEQWKLSPMIDTKESNIFKSNFAQNAKIASGDFFYGEEKIPKGTRASKRMLDEYFKFMNQIEAEIKQFSINNELSNFLIFAPENYFLRNSFDENQIKPLGIRGEGLFRHLADMSFKKTGLFKELKENLNLIEWFDDLEFDMTADGYFTGRIKIKDIYLEEGVQYFDQKSANEGFLYLLFYLTLFMSDKTPKFFAIDNIDNALNPKLAADLMKVLAQLAEKHGKQVIFTTHNPAILDGLNLNDPEQRLFVISRNAVGHTKALRIEKKPIPSNGQSTKLSEQFLRGYIGGLNF